MATVNCIEIVKPEVYTHNATQAKAFAFCLFVRPALLTPAFTKLNIYPSQLINVATTVIAHESNKEITLPACYKKYKNVFSDKNAYTLPEHVPPDHAIKLIEGKQPFWGPIYLLSKKELTVLQAYIDLHIKTEFIQPSQSPASAPILFVKKPRSGLCLCVDYRGFNNATIKNRYPLPLVGESLN